MKPKLLLGLALVLSGGLFVSIATAQEANASIRETYQISLPTKLSVTQIKGVLKIRTDKQSLEVTNLSIGTNMMVSMWCDVYVYETGSSRPTNYCHTLESNGVFCPDISVTKELYFDSFIFFWRPDGDGLAQPMWASRPWIWTHEGSVVHGKSYAVEMDLALFETDYKGKITHNWDLKKAAYYKVIWRRTLKQIIE
jgi:hypothetical protein